MFDWQPWQWMLLVVGAFVVGVSKTGISGMGVLTVAIFANLLPPKQSTGVLLPLLVVADVVAVAAYRRHAVWFQLRRLIPWLTVGILIGYYAMDHINDTQVRRIIGVILLVMVTLHLWRRKQGQPVPPHALWFTAATGLIAGFTTMVANAAGPIMTLYMLSIGLPKMEFLGTGAWYFLLVNVFKLPLSHHLGLITGESLKFDALLAPVVILGALLGQPFVKRINQAWFEALALGMTLIAGLRLVW
jgi:uncharacterized membrane protein YfcA